MQILDGPYIAFVASVKLEQAYNDISMRGADAEEEEARLLQQKEDEPAAQYKGAGGGGDDVIVNVQGEGKRSATPSDKDARQQGHGVRQQQEVGQAAGQAGAGAGVFAGDDDGVEIVWPCTSDFNKRPTAHF